MAMQNRDRLLRKLAAIQGRPRAAMRGALDKGSDEIVALAKHLAPKRTGALAKSIGKTFGDYTPDNANVRGVSSAGGGDPDLTVVIHAGDEEAYYAGWVENGTAPHPAGGKFEGAQNPGTPAQPFFFPAYRTLRKKVKSSLARAASKAIREGASNG
jgi:HK97 gp10 family phage protein